jgi:hypothetical protein
MAIKMILQNNNCHYKSENKHDTDGVARCNKDWPILIFCVINSNWVCAWTFGHGVLFLSTYVGGMADEWGNSANWTNTWSK